MKKIFILFALAICLSFVSCSSENEDVFKRDMYRSVEIDQEFAYGVRYLWFDQDYLESIQYPVEEILFNLTDHGPDGPWQVQALGALFIYLPFEGAALDFEQGNEIEWRLEYLGIRKMERRGKYSLMDEYLSSESEFNKGFEMLYYANYDQGYGFADTEQFRTGLYDFDEMSLALTNRVKAVVSKNDTDKVRVFKLRIANKDLGMFEGHAYMAYISRDIYLIQDPKKQRHD